MRRIYKFLFVAVIILINAEVGWSQSNSVSIGTTSTNASAVLWLNSPGGNQGLIIPVGSRANVATPAKGMIIFDTNQVYFYDGTQWAAIGGSGAASQTISISGNQINVGGLGSASANLSSNTPSSANQFFIWNGSAWTAVSVADVSSVGGNLVVSGIQGKTIALPSSGVQYLSYDATQGKWIFQTPSGSVPTISQNQILSNDGTTTKSFAVGGDLTLTTGANANFSVAKISSLSTNGLVKTSGGTGALSIATAGADYAPPVPGSAILKGNGSGGFSSAVSGTDYAPATSGSFILSGNGSGGFSNIIVGSGLSLSTGTLSATGGFVNPMTTVGDIIYENATPAPARLPGNTTSTKMFLSQTGSGGLSAAPAWVALASADIPNLSASKITTGILGTTVGGTGINTTPTANQLLTTDGTSAVKWINQNALNTVGTITSGTWNATPITEAFGGTNQTSYAAGDILYAASPTSLAKLAIGGPNQVLTVNTGGTAPFWSTPSSNWGLSGNDISSLPASFIGTTNNAGLRFKTNGNNSGLLDPVNSNSFFGYLAGNLTTGAQNVAVGTNALVANTSGGGNIALGVGALQTNTAGSGNIAIGKFADVSSNSLTNAIAIGANAIVGASNALVLGGTGTNSVNVGIGTATPSAPLQVQNGTTAPGTGNGNIEVHTYNGSGSAVYADLSTGGDGTGTLYSRGTISSYEVNGTGNNNTGVWGHQYGNGSGGWGVLASNGASVTAPTTYAGLGGVSYPGIFMGGNVGIGTVSPSSGLHVYGTNGTTLTIDDSPGSAGSASATLKLNAYGNVLFGGPVTDTYTISGNTFLPFLSFAINGTTMANMSTSFFAPGGDNTISCGSSSDRWTYVYAANGTIQTSDIRLKTNIKPLNYGLSEVLKFNPVSYSWKTDEKSKKIGLIAQEVKSLVPEVVSEGKYLGMNYAELVPVLIKAIQEQQKLIDDQKKQIEELKNSGTQKEASVQLELNQLKSEIANIKKALGMEASTKKSK